MAGSATRYRAILAGAGTVLAPAVRFTCLRALRAGLRLASGRAVPG
jgi:hypothetical protein